jgi:hypothetical protein
VESDIGGLHHYNIDQKADFSSANRVTNNLFIISGLFDTFEYASSA